jgi:hypothetical protein
MKVPTKMSNPPRDVMLSHAAREMGYGWGFGVHEALDQAGALFGPLLVTAVLSRRNRYPAAFGTLLAPAITTLALLVIARFAYPRPREVTAETVTDANFSALPRTFWIPRWCRLDCCRVRRFLADRVPFYKDRGGRSDMGANLLFGCDGCRGSRIAVIRLFVGSVVLGVLVPLTIVSLLSTPLAFLGNFWRPYWVSRSGDSEWARMNL